MKLWKKRKEEGLSPSIQCLYSSASKKILFCPYKEEETAKEEEKAYIMDLIRINAKKRRRRKKKTAKKHSREEKALDSREEERFTRSSKKIRSTLRFLSFEKKKQQRS